MEQINLSWFAFLNADANLHGFKLGLAVFSAKYLALIVLLGVFFLWLKGDKQTRETILLAFLACFIALFINWFIGCLWYHPRPFVMGVGHTFLPHAPDSSFPSDHASSLFSLSFVFLWRARSWISYSLLLAASCVAWARVYVGVHFPFDILGSMVVSLFATGVVIYGNKLYICKGNHCNLNAL